MRHMFDLEAFATDLHVARWKSDMTMQELADRVGVSKAAVWRWENGKQEPPLLQALLLERFFTLKMKSYIKEVEDGQRVMPRFENSEEKDFWGNQMEFFAAEDVPEVKHPEIGWIIDTGKYGEYGWERRGGKRGVL